MRAFFDEVIHDLDIYFTAAVDCSDFVEQAFYLKTKTLLLPFAASGLSHFCLFELTVNYGS